MNEPNTGNTTLEILLQIVGLLYTLLTLLAALPKGLSITQLAARFGADLRNERSDTKPSSSVPPTVGLLLLLACGCQGLRDAAAPTVVGCAPNREYVIEQLDTVLRGDNAFSVLDRVKKEKGQEFVMCALQKFIEQSTNEAVKRIKAQAYIERESR